MSSCMSFSSSSSVPAAFSPQQPLSFNFFTGANESWFEYPETAASGNYTIPSLLDKPKLGIAVSGGGFRAATLGLGWLRALHMLNVTSKARYLTSNSGGSWLNAAFSFQDSVPLDSFLGPYLPPQQLSQQQLQQADSGNGSFAGVIANAGILIPGAADAVEDAFRSLKPGQQLGIGAWSNAIGRAFLAPYNLNSDASTITAAGTVGPIHQAAANLSAQQQLQVYTYRPTTGPAGSSSSSRPFPIMMGSIMLPDTPLGFYTIEFSPLYIGSPAFFNDTTPPIGGGFVDPIGFNTPPPDPKPTLPSPILQAFAATAANATGFNNGSLRTNSSAPAANVAAGNGSNSSSSSNSSASSGGRQLLRLQPLNVTAQPTYVVPLKSLVGISSSFITNMFQPGGEITRQLTGTEALDYWNQITFEGATLAFADGGSADNLAITPLLRRRVPKIVVCVAASANISAATSPADWAGYQWDISALFGAAPPTHPSYNENNTIVGIPIDLFNRKLQVFPTQGYDELFYAVRNSTAAGGPSFHMATYDVLTNSFQAIFGGWQVEVLWVVNAQQTKWEQALPQDTAAALASSRDSGKKNSGVVGNLVKGVRETISQVAGGGDALDAEGFPFISTGKANYSPGLCPAKYPVVALLQE
ncbi:hypothetical protein OEZ86_002377 [Tetradesmus obliquus]|nr:hypothetical protein OEZ86_002377 [Tetradesmus obliquus]